MFYNLHLWFCIYSLCSFNLHLWFFLFCVLLIACFISNCTFPCTMDAWSHLISLKLKKKFLKKWSKAFLLKKIDRKLSKRLNDEIFLKHFFLQFPKSDFYCWISLISDMWMVWVHQVASTINLKKRSESEFWNCWSSLQDSLLNWNCFDQLDIGIKSIK